MSRRAKGGAQQALPEVPSGAEARRVYAVKVDTARMVLENLLEEGVRLHGPGPSQLVAALEFALAGVRDAHEAVGGGARE